MNAVLYRLISREMLVYLISKKRLNSSEVRLYGFEGGNKYFHQRHIHICQSLRLGLTKILTFLRREFSGYFKVAHSELRIVSQVFDCSRQRVINSTTFPFFSRPLPKVHTSYPHLSFSFRDSTKMSSEAPITDKQIASTHAKIEARKRFESVFPLLVDEAITHLRSIHLPENAIEWYKQVNFN